MAHHLIKDKYAGLKPLAYKYVNHLKRIKI